MIPRIIHRVWLRDPMPPVFARFGDRWRELNPGWEFIDWTDVDGMELPATEIRERAREVLPRDWKRFEADVLRLEILYVHGGLYVDTDVEPLVPIDRLLEGRRALVARSPQADCRGYHAITNCVMAAEPAHPYFGALLEGLAEAIEQYGHKHLARMIGPWHLERTHAAGDWPTVDVLKWRDMVPWLTHYWNNRRRQRGEGLA